MNNLFQKVNFNKPVETEKSMLVSTLFILLLIIGGNFLAPLFPCSIQRYFTNNMFPKHVLGFLTLYFFVEVVNKNSESTLISSFKESIGLYVWFLFASKMDKPFFIGLVSILFIMYSLNLFIDQEKEKQEKINEDMIIQQDLQNISTFKNIENMLFSLALGVTLYGTYSYYSRKRLEYKNNFNLNLFIFGKPNCKN